MARFIPTSISSLLLLHFKSPFPQQHLEASCSSCFSNCHHGGPSLHGGDGSWEWLEHLISGPCQQHILALALSIIIIISYSLILVWQRVRFYGSVYRPIKLHHSGLNGVHIEVSQTKRIGLLFKLTALSCCYMLLLNVLAFVCGIWKAWSGWTELLLLMCIASAVQAIAWVVISLATDSVRKTGAPKFPGLLRVWWLLSFSLCLYRLSMDIIIARRTGSMSFQGWLEVCSFPACVWLGLAALIGKSGVVHVVEEIHQPFLNTNGTGGREGVVHGCEFVTPYSKAGVLSLMTFSWLNPLLAVGARKHLDLKDIPLLAHQDRAEVSYMKLKHNWDKLKAENSSRPPYLFMAIAKSFWRESAWNALFALFNVLASYVGPYSINDFVEYLGGRRRFAREGVFLALLFFGSKLVESLTQRQWYMGIDILGLHVRSALTAFVYHKGLRLSNSSRQGHTSGEIINYMAVDVQRVGDFSWYLQDTWVLPLQILLAMAILIRSVGWAACATLVATFISILGNIPLVKMQEDYQDKLMTAKDERMKSTSECLRSMRILKLQAWENRYCKKVEKLREEEYGWLRKALYTQAAVTFIFWGAPIFVSVVTFGTCVLMGIPLTAGRVLSALATFRVLQEPLRNIPDLLSTIAQTRVSLDRLWIFLQEEELQEDASIRLPCDDRTENAVEIEDASFSWDESVACPTLKNINLRVKKGMRVAICGVVGSGKSSLLSCILGEIPKLSGTVKVVDSTAYVAQSAWIQSGKIKDNILFGKKMDRMRYENVLQVCALKKDLELFAYGDLTEIGERGINLSGGQKQRIQLARALYHDAELYLLDDPFSAVDAHTGTELFKKCILGDLSTKTVFFVTHQVEFLPAADLILVMRNGEIIQAGKYDELLQAGADFNALVDAHIEAIEAMDINEYLVGYEDDFEDKVEVDRAGGKLNKVGSKNADRVGGKLNKMGSKKDKSRKAQLVQEEERERGSVNLHVYWSYLTAAYGGALIPVILFAQSMFQFLQIASNWWMAWASPTTHGRSPRVGNLLMILVYTALAFGSAIFVFVRAMLVSVFGLVTAQKLFVSMLSCIFRAPMSFFDSTPAGRILNRASTDQSVVDLDIPFRLGGFASTTIQLFGIVGVMTKVTWQVIILFLTVVAICVWMQQYYMASARELSRLVGISKSPIIHHYSESIYGVATIRGFGQEERFKKTNMDLYDSYGRPYFNSFAAIEWLCLRMEILSTCVFAFSMALLVSFPVGVVDASIAGLAVTYGLTLNARQSRWVLSLCKLENKIISVERIQQYTRIPSEAPLVRDNCRPPKDWPSEGTVDIENLQVRYSSRTPIVLHGVTCTFPGGKKVGVVGRTGSGKSTLIQALFRMVEPIGGRIIIDGIDICRIGLHDLRSRLSIIPQDPTLFEGTVRANLDPLEEHSDTEIWEALDKCQLGDLLRSREDKLDSPVTENGENWSVGQRQLFCLGRALLRRTRILVLDEATASVDTATDGVVQRTIRAEFLNCTVITVAHRIPTVIDSDLVLVLSDGKVAEFDTPIRLLEEKSSMFLRLVTEYSIRSSSVSDLTLIGSHT
ncbi:ABC transporter C family member 5 [Selaginella moellendorffii]|uniref:ABC transporter C family member 5 n=1 Tax=Selaginella moellendorffii TaxID=88036 RepID=UPI000D1C5BCB|nr:ABC transporter C family member 5 [Selaginella moellendorffii]|eukprot:XP_024530299.1 ABC transporter C family member 5 [Selaginella moellendorffii]